MYELQRKESFKARGKGNIIEYKIKHFYHFGKLENSGLVYIQFKTFNCFVPWTSIETYAQLKKSPMSHQLIYRLLFAILPLPLNSP